MAQERKPPTHVADPVESGKNFARSLKIGALWEKDGTISVFIHVYRVAASTVTLILRRLAQNRPRSNQRCSAQVRCTTKTTARTPPPLKITNDTLHRFLALCEVMVFVVAVLAIIAVREAILTTRTTAPRRNSALGTVECVKYC
jgi:hypothetical protein